MAAHNPDIEWVSLSPEEKAEFEKLAKCPASQPPTFFNLTTDSNNAPGKFPDLSNAEILARAVAAGKWLVKG